jgi:hypothetical protein
LVLLWTENWCSITVPIIIWLTLLQQSFFLVQQEVVVPSEQMLGEACWTHCCSNFLQCTCQVWRRCCCFSLIILFLPQKPEPCLFVGLKISGWKRGNVCLGLEKYQHLLSQACCVWCTFLILNLCAHPQYRTCCSREHKQPCHTQIAHHGDNTYIPSRQPQQGTGKLGS